MPIHRWFHVECFVNGRDELGWKWAASALEGFSDLKKSEQKSLEKKLPSKDTGKVPKLESVKEPKDEPGPSRSSVSKEEAILKKQSKLMFGFIDNLKNLRRGEIQEIFTVNGMNHIPPTVPHRLEYIADALAFGKPQQCPQCHDYIYFKVRLT